MVGEGTNMMKKIGLLALITTYCLNACPTCVGRISPSSPPFFSDGFYKPAAKQESKQIIKEASQEENDDREDED
jgi:hypothetical protein